MLSWTVKAKIINIELDLHFDISNNILKFEKLWLNRSWVIARTWLELQFFNLSRTIMSWTVKAKNINIELDLHFAISNNILKFEKLWLNSPSPTEHPQINDLIKFVNKNIFRWNMNVLYIIEEITNPHCPGSVVIFESHHWPKNSPWKCHQFLNTFYC